MVTKHIILLGDQLVKALHVYYEVSVVNELHFEVEVAAVPCMLNGFREEVMNWMVLPGLKGKQLTFKEVIKMLVLSGFAVPLWIRLLEKEKGKLYLLIISPQFRTKPVIAGWHHNNELMPFVAV